MLKVVTAIKAVDNLVALIDIRRDDFLIKWRLSDLCNYHCSYCIRNNRGGDKRKPYNRAELLSTEDKLCEVSKNIKRMLQGLPYHHVKVSVIGGEPSIFNLERIFSGLTGVVAQIYITTNLSREAEYYNRLFDFGEKNNIKITICGSFHPDFTTIDDFFGKVDSIVEKNMDYFSCEIVSNIFNQDVVKQFRQRCIYLGVDYKIEKDLINTQYIDYIMQESSFRRREPYYLSYGGEGGITFYKARPSNQDVIDVTNARYVAFFSDGSCELFGSRNEFLTKMCKNNGNMIQTGEKYYCTHSNNFINILYDKVVGRRSAGTSCRESIDIKEFNVLPIEDSMCSGGCINCSLCGSMSIAKDLGFLKFDYNL